MIKWEQIEAERMKEKTFSDEFDPTYDPGENRIFSTIFVSIDEVQNIQ